MTELTEFVVSTRKSDWGNVVRWMLNSKTTDIHHNDVDNGWILYILLFPSHSISYSLKVI